MPRSSGSESEHRPRRVGHLARPRVRRLRQIVSPDGELAEELNEIELALLGAEGLEAEAGAVGLRPAGRREISATDVHVGSTVVLLKKGA